MGKMLLLLFFCFPVYADSPAFPAESMRLRDNIKALDHAWQQANQDLELKRREKTLAAREERDYALFIDYLGRRIVVYCQELVNNFGILAVSGLPCQVTAAELQGKGGSPAQTTDEKVAALDSSLTEMLGEFDEMLLKEDERVTATMAQQQSVQADNGSGGAGNGSADSTSELSGAADDNSENQQDGAETQVAGGKQATDNHARAGGVSSLGVADDDIVARQLREAAEKESDPELKEKLWEEYRKYKRGG